MTDSSLWTGRPVDAPLPVEAARRRWNAFLWPSYRCEACDGSGPWGCYCAAKGAIAPGVPAEPWRVWLRKLPRCVRRLRRS